MTDGSPEPRVEERTGPITVEDHTVRQASGQPTPGAPAQDQKNPGQKAKDKSQPAAGWASVVSAWSSPAKNIVETIEKVVIVAVLIGGIAYGLPLIEAEHTKAERDKAIATAEMATREAAAKQILDIDLSAQLVSPIERQRFVVLTLELKNTGNRVLTIPHESLKATIRNVQEIEGTGTVRYVEGEQTFQFAAFSDTKSKEMTLSPGEHRKLQSVQKFRSEGLHVVTADIALKQPEDGKSDFHATLFTHLN